jgi:hypothetical protein
MLQPPSPAAFSREILRRGRRRECSNWAIEMYFAFGWIEFNKQYYRRVVNASLHFIMRMQQQEGLCIPKKGKYYA